MKSQPKSLAAILALLVLGSCGGYLPESLHREIRTENDRLREATEQLKRSDEIIQKDIAGHPEFNGVPEPDKWRATLKEARSKLDRAEQSARQLQQLARRDRADSRPAAERLLSEERALRTSAAEKSQQVQREAEQWIAFSKDPAGSVSKMGQTYEAIRNTNLDGVTDAVHKAEKDWPAKSSLLEARLASLCKIPDNAESEWTATAAARQNISAGRLGGAQLATLAGENDTLENERRTLETGSTELLAMTGQLYNAWDKVLTDLELSHFGREPVYRERINTITTHWTDVPANKTEVSNDEHWVTVSEPAYKAVENDLGMTIAHKDAGSFDSEAQTKPQPPAFAYVAPVEQGHNQYGYWTHSNGNTFWTFLPQYLILRELLRVHDYRPITIDEYNGYRTAQRAGTTYYGNRTVDSKPTYGTHGSFTQQNYASSRYVQSGGFKGSAYASRPSGSGFSTFNGPRPEPHNSVGPAPSGGAGKRFGFGASPSSGRRFGRSGGFSSPGRGFGRRR